jgi:ParB family chromosome partitioning protein
MQQIIPRETQRLSVLEATIERGQQTFIEVGMALLEIRESRLYRQSYSTFEDYCKERWGWSRVSADRHIQAARIARLLPIGSVQTESQAREFAVIKDDPGLISEVWQSVSSNGHPTAEKIRDAVALHRPHVSRNSGDNEWYTPDAYLDAARSVLGTIDLDPASSAIANQRVKATTFYTSSNDGLTKHWAGRVWMNPPYSADLIGLFAEKLNKHIAATDVTEAIVLVNNATETVWFNRLVSVACAVAFPASRIRFIDPQGQPSGAPLQGQAVIYAGNKPALFAEQFSPFGWIASVYNHAV